MSKMIETGIPWLPQVAEGFSIGHVKQFFYVSKDLSDEGEPEHVLKLARAGIVEKDVTTNEGQMASSYSGYNRVKVGDLLLNPMDLYSGANCNVSELDGVISPAYSNLRAKTVAEVVPKYYDYYFKTQYWLMAMFAHGKGVSFDNRWTLNNDSLRAYEIPVVSYTVQQRIVERIQSEEKKADSLIANVQAQIEKLKAYKTSIITEAVTLGLNTSASYKDSGLQWVSKMPDNWDNRKMISILSMRVVDGPHESPVLQNEGIPYISATAIENGKINFDLMRGYISEEYCDLCDIRYKPQLHDILVIKLGASTGQVAIVETEDRFNIWVPLAAVRCNEEADPYFVYYAFQSDYFKRQMELSWTYGTQQTLGVKTIERLRILLPPLSEQKEIVDYLDLKRDQIDRLIAIKQSKIEKLEQYKKSLIYEYVTGKKEIAG